MTHVLADSDVPAPVPASPRAAGTGAMLAVCALCGGAGASTLAYLVGASVAAVSDAQVLVCDAGEPTAGLSAYAGVESLHSLGELATELQRDGQVSDGLFADARPGLRLIAAAPRLHEEVNPTAVARLLSDAREEHLLTVVDCGRLATADGRMAQQYASHVVWILPATVSGVLRGRRVLGAHEPTPGQVEIIVARSDRDRRQAPIAELTALAAKRLAPLVLMPHIPDLGEHTCEEALDEAQVTLEALGSMVRR